MGTYALWCVFSEAGFLKDVGTQGWRLMRDKTPELLTLHECTREWLNPLGNVVFLNVF